MSWVAAALLLLQLLQLWSGACGYTLDDVALHSGAADCWSVFHGGIYSFPGGGTLHPGISIFNYGVCGGDGTALFDTQHTVTYLSTKLARVGGSYLGAVSAPAPTPAPTTTTPAPTTTTPAPTTTTPAPTTTTPAPTTTTAAVTTTTLGATTTTPTAATTTANTGGVVTGATTTTPAATTTTPVATTTTMTTTPEPTTTTLVPTTTTSAPTTTTVQVGISLEDVRMHSGAADCWVIFHGGVYSFPGGGVEHPGISIYNYGVCGGDGTVLYDTKHTEIELTTKLKKVGGIYLDVAAPAPPPSTTTPGATTSQDAALGTVEEPGPTLRSCRADEPLPPVLAVTAAEVQRHSSKGDCWMVVGCGVYDLAAYAHGGGDIIYTYCGTDATQGFETEHPWLYLDLMLRLGAVLVGTLSGTFETPMLAASAETLAEHSSAGDCWSCVAGTVYDLSFYADEHPGGFKVVEAMCGVDGTGFFLKAHALEVVEAYRKVGTCSTGHTATEEQLLDALALVLLLLPPLAASALAIHCAPPRLQDRLLRHPVHAPLHSKFWGGLLNPYLEMPLGILIILQYFLLTVGVIFALWLNHYSLYYPERVVLPGALGRVTVYLVSLATYFGTKRLSIGWQLWAVSFERTLKLHYVVGTLASVFMLAHCGSYMQAWGPADLPGKSRLTGYVLLYSILVLFPAAVVTNLRIRFYAIFKITHFFAPFIMVVGILHVCLLNVDSGVSSGLLGSVIWLAVATWIFFSDLVWTWRDASVRRAEIVEGPWLLRDTSGTDFIIVRLKKNVKLFPGSWLKVVCPQVNSALSHPFTAILVDQPDNKPAIFDFVWKVNKPKSWTANLRDAIQDLQKSGQVAPVPPPAVEGQAEHPPLKAMQFLVAGPYGGGLGLLGAMNTFIFVMAGVGIATAASIVPALLKQGKCVHVIWSARSEALIRHCCAAYFSPPAGQSTNGGGLHLQVHFTGRAEASLEGPQVLIARGRPNISLSMRNAVATAVSSRKESEVAVFACGPEELVRSSFAAARALNEEMDGKVHVHVHSESFQF